MRILVVTNLFPPEAVGGWELGCQQMAAELHRRNHEVRVLTSVPRTFEPADDPHYVQRVLHLEEVWDPALLGGDAPVRVTRRMFVDTHNIEILHQAIESFAPDVIYLWNLVGIGAAALLLAVDMRGLPWVVHLMDAMPKHMASAALGGRERFAELLFRRLHGTWIACSQGLVDENRAVGATLHGDLNIIPNWVTGARPSVRERWYRPGATLRCAYAGQIVASKGIGIIIDAVAALRREGRAVQVDLFGDGLDRARFELQLIESGVGSAVHFRGHVEHGMLMKALGDYDVMLFPTEMREPFGFAPLEAAASGCVPLITDGAGICEWLVPGMHLLTARRDSAAVCAALRDIIDGEVDLAPIGRRAQRAVLSEFHIDTVGGAVESVLTGAARSQPRRQPAASWQHIGRLARLGELLADSVLAGH